MTYAVIYHIVETRLNSKQHIKGLVVYNVSLACATMVAKTLNVGRQDTKIYNACVIPVTKKADRVILCENIVNIDNMIYQSNLNGGKGSFNYSPL